MNWLYENGPERAETFQPGLSRTEIDYLIRALPIQLTEELYEIYQWRNGSTDWNNTNSLVSPTLEFMPLEEAIKHFYDLSNSFTEIHSSNEAYFCDRFLFPVICENSSCYYAVMLENEKKISSPVIDISGEGDLDIVFSSLMEMMKTLAEYCETGTYYIDSEGFLATK